MKYVASLCLNMPEEFSQHDFEAMMVAGRAVTEKKAEQRTEFLRASNLIAWRFRAFIEHHQAYRSSWEKMGAAAGHEDVFRREQLLTSMFYYGESAIEVTSYAAYAMCAAIDRFGFSFTERDRTKHKLADFKKKLNAHPELSDLADGHVALLESSEWCLWINYRNTMTHRSAVLPTIIGGTDPLPPPEILGYDKTWSTPELKGDINRFDGLVKFIAERQGQLLKAMVLIKS